ncbi:hypothetical protein HGRIS_004746 [Hohenbuehelia grisea]|uniref:Uncharacterized protein n=1 Tax=Hohenbuehelia grisea TaxID=104357 RepID=A0ABR3JCU0_9AGAR
MDDPWANAWGQESDIAADDSKELGWQQNAGMSLWTGSQEPPEWEPSTYEDLQLSKPATEDVTYTPEPWTGSQEPQDAPSWQPSTFDEAKVGTNTVDDDSPPAETWSAPQELEDAPGWQPAEQDDTQIPASPPTVIADVLEAPERPSTPPSSEPSSPDLPVADIDATDADGFGSFSSGLGRSAGVEHDPWAPPAVIEDADGWGGPEPTWQDEEEGDPSSPTQDVSSNDSQPVDEWAEARRQKERQDRTVPPELLASIFAQFETLSKDLWPESEKPHPEDYRNDRFRGMNGVLDLLDAASSRLVPTIATLSLPPLPAPRSTFTHKSLIEALKLTRHMPIVQKSPMAFYLASKGNASWDAAVRARGFGAAIPHPTASPDTISPGTTPTQSQFQSGGTLEGDFASGGLGWRVLGKDEREEFDVWSDGLEGKNKKAAGGSWFWNRKNSVNINGNIAVLKGDAAPSSTSARSSTSRAASPARPPSMVSKISVASPRSSVDSARSGSGFNGSTISASTPAMSGTSTPISSVPQTPTLGSPGASQTAFSLQDTQAPPPAVSPTAPPPPPSEIAESPSVHAPAPSAVSRFLNRFSRAKSSTANRPSHPQHLALSSNDLEFLGDIHGSGDSGPTSLLDDDAFFESSIGSKPKVEAKLPPPLAPPPKAPKLHPIPPISPTTLPLPTSGVPSPVSLSPAIGPMIPQGFNMQAAIGPSSSSSAISATFLDGLRDSNVTPHSSNPESMITTGPSSLNAPPGHRGTAPDLLPAFSEASSSQHSEPPASMSALDFDALDAFAPKPVPQIPRPSPNQPASRSISRGQPQAKRGFTAIMSTSSNSSATGVFDLPPPPLFSFPPPPGPSSRVATPGVPSRTQTPLRTPEVVLSPPSDSMMLAVPPPPKQSGTNLLGSGDDDDDDFADFHSSPAVPSNLNSSPDTATLSGSFGAPLSLPDSAPISNASMFNAGQIVHPLSTVSPPASALSSSSSAAFNSLLPSSSKSSSAQPSFAGDDFDDFVSSPIRSPSPPKPPAKSPPMSHSGPLQSFGVAASSFAPPLPLPPKEPSGASRMMTPPPRPDTTGHKPQSSIAQRRKADHTRTMSLLETAAARPGVWPAPRSPIAPMIAAPPSNPQKASLVSMDAFSFPGDSMMPSVSSPAVLRGQTSNSPVQPLSPPEPAKSASPPATGKVDDAFGAFGGGSTVTSPVAFFSASSPKPAQPSGAKNNGLSAQDLSFFEGL